MSGEGFGHGGCREASKDVLELSLDVRRVLGRVERQPLRADFRFDRDTPVLVSVTLTPPRGRSVTWRISRELLYRGLSEPSGEGDVRIWPVPGERGELAWLRLASRETSAVLELPVAALAQWFEATYRLVSAEQTRKAAELDWEAFVTQLRTEP
ncbi:MULTISPECIES: SsgA family sporulation/cell division regulator [unclassified Kitasatospora]|uniref:SsgA family sporulation/cell division regulator n=1 Tax=unclassified Kitasatospora TaxID=2633591 RepID=UPI003403BBD6